MIRVVRLIPFHLFTVHKAETGASFVALPRRHGSERHPTPKIRAVMRQT